MKVGTDGVLLGAWLKCQACKRLLDVGTGSGLIALMAAQKCAAEGDFHFKILAIDIDEGAVTQAKSNFASSPWADNLSAVQISLQDLALSQKVGSFDLIFSNPPYFPSDSSLSSPNEKRDIARSDETLPMSNLLAYSAKIMSPTGKMAVVLPFSQETAFIMAAACEKLFVSRRCYFRSQKEKTPIRVLIEISRQLPEIVLTTSITNGDESYLDLTKYFYFY